MTYNTIVEICHHLQHIAVAVKCYIIVFEHGKVDRSRQKNVGPRLIHCESQDVGRNRKYTHAYTVSAAISDCRSLLELPGSFPTSLPSSDAVGSRRDRFQRERLGTAFPKLF